MLEQPDRERVSIDAWMIPFNAQQYGLATSLIGPPSTQQITRAPGDVAFVQATVRGGRWRPSIDTHHLFLGLQDVEVVQDLSEGRILRMLGILRTAPGYLGAWPQQGFLDFLPGLLRSEPDAQGYSRLPLGLWRRQFEGFSVLSFLLPVLESVTPHLTVEQTDSEAQARIYISDLSGAKITSWLNQLYQERARQASVGNARFLHTLSQQLGVPRADARSVGEDLLDVQLVCPLGGEYRLNQQPAGVTHWVSTAWDGTSDPGEAVAPYQAPVLDWFRGLSADLTMEANKLFLHAELDMQRKPRQSPIQLPLFDLLKNKLRSQPAVGPEPSTGSAQPEPEPQPPVPEALPEPLPPPPPPEDE